MCKSKKIFLFFLIASITACAKAPVKTSHDLERHVDTELTATAKKIHRDLTLLASLAQQDKIVSGKYRYQPTPNAPELKNPIQMLWNGPLEPAIKTVAKSIGWTCAVVGKRPIQPIIVQVRSDNKDQDSAIEIIESCGWQAGEKVLVSVIEKEKKLRITYLD